MDKQPITIRIPCSRHTSEHIQRVSTDANASQHLFCLECVLQQTQEAGPIGSGLKTIPDFIDTAAQFYSQHKHATTSASDVPDEYIGLLSKQSEAIETLSNHIASQKNIVESEFDALIRDVLQLLTDQKNKHLHALDQQLLNLRYWYTSFAKKVKKTYPTPDDIPTLYPSRDDLVNKVQKITNDTQLTAFIRGIKDDIHEVNKPMRNERLSLEETRKKELSELAKQLSEVEHRRPVYEMKDYNRSELVEKLSKEVESTLERVFELSNPVSDISHGLYDLDSKILKSEQYGTLREWLEPKYQSRQPKLLYRGQKDGMDANVFHQKCDEKGPTITLLKIRSTTNPSEMYIVGGFAEEPWISGSGSWTGSKGAFVFSITNKLKCALLPGAGDKAICRERTYGPVFGEYDIHVMPGFKNVSMGHKSYSDSLKLVKTSVHSNVYSYSSQTTFELSEIEVFGI